MSLSKNSNVDDCDNFQIRDERDREFSSKGDTWEDGKKNLKWNLLLTNGAKPSTKTEWVSAVYYK